MMRPIPTDRALLAVLARDLMDAGQLVEAGWAIMRKVCIPADLPAQQVEDMRMAYLAGAHHVFSSMHAALDTGDDEMTDTDHRRLTQLQHEIQSIAPELERWARRLMHH